MAVDDNMKNASPKRGRGSEQVSSDATPEIHGDGEESDSRSPGNSDHGSGDDTPAKKNAKDPSRPRRKKARRACFACQRAHLTCGDERPCLRCIKRGLQDQCHDGMRKKAKYLHDAPPEALVPGMGGSYHPQTNQQTPSKDDPSPMSQPSGYFPSRTSTSEYVSIQSAGNDGQASTLRSADPSMDAFGNPNRNSFSGADNGSMAAPPQPTEQNPVMRQNSQSYGNMPFDPTDPHFFNFDISGLNFGNRYGALEFGMLGHMSSGVFESPDDNGLLGSLNYDSTTGYSPLGSNMPYGGGGNNFQSWPTPQSTGQRQGSAAQSFALHHHQDGNPSAFAIGEGSGSVTSASPGNTGLDHITGYNSSPVLTSQSPFQQRRSQSEIVVPPPSQSSTSHTNPFATKAGQGAPRRRRDPSVIYRSVKEPYSYTTGFHLLTAFLARRFSKDKTLKIAKALASIRPSFISCTRELSRDDLIFMEKGFQRNLLLYDDYINAYGSPTLICRRTGEIAAVSKEFSLLTGWRRDVLLGKEPNLNVNHGTSASINATGEATGSSSRGAATPSKANATLAVEPGRPQPVFLAELLDDDTAVQFYDDFAKMAFGDSRGQVQRRGKLLKYKTKEDPGWGRELDGSAGGDRRSGAEPGKDRNGHTSNRHRMDKFGRGIDILGEKDGKVDVMFCHIVKRDTFDIPMMIIMNVSRY